MDFTPADRRGNRIRNDATRDPDRDHKQHRSRPVSPHSLGARPLAAQAPPEASRPAFGREGLSLLI